ncbi:MAG: protein arginine kinase [Candidatus Omnitrophica bacterium]|nr:protein arginine kinase [Candidatus Omnitrophota bacterium]MBU4479141.1 protein arginine kinase [Candidatus Omnitrophota bacterium]
MKINDLVKQTSGWLKGVGPNSEIVFSSRVRLARNLEKVLFSNWADKEKQEEALAILEPTVNALEQIKDNGLYLKMNDVLNVDKQFLVERHLISREHITKSGAKAVVISADETLSIMLNEEDHLRIQILLPGFALDECWNKIEQCDTALEKKLSFAFSAKWGYLTACPTNTGTGMRASVMLHLPALVMTKQINRVIQAIVKLGLTVRGLFGEGTEAAGNIFQISNQVSLGRSEEEIIDNIKRIINQVIEYEQNARQVLCTKNTSSLDDQVWRSYGILKNAHIISSSETIELLSNVRLGCDVGLIKGLTREVINELFILTQPAHLQKLEGKTLNAQQRDVKRAELIRDKIK